MVAVAVVVEIGIVVVEIGATAARSKHTFAVVSPAAHGHMDSMETVEERASRPETCGVVVDALPPLRLSSGSCFCDGGG